MANFVFIVGILSVCLICQSSSTVFSNFRKSIHLAPHLKPNDFHVATLNTHVNRRKDLSEIPNFLQGALRDLHKPRLKRDVDDNLKPTSSMFVFNDSHTQMVIHWAGQESNAIIALAKGLEIGPGSIPLASRTSNVFVSHNYGRNFTSVKDKLQLYDGSPALISQFFNSPAFNSHYMFVDEEHNYIFRTQDYGTTILRQQVVFKPSRVLFHQTNYRLALAMDTSKSSDGILYLTQDFGETWRLLQRGVRAFYWEDNRYGFNSSCIYILRLTANDMGNIIRSCDFFNSDMIELLSFVHDFEIQGAYMFATRQRQLLGGSGVSHQIWVSYYRGQFFNAQFPHALNHSDYYVADTSEDQIFLCVSHDEKTTHLYVSDVNGTKFSLALDDILYFHPNGSNADSWLKYYMDQPFADLEKVEGMRGVYIATQLMNKMLAADHQRSLISFDKGATWQLLVAPERDVFNRPTNCSVNANCSLHLTQLFDRLYAGSRSTPILSRESAPGIIMATGNTGQRIHVDDTSGVFVSSDAGFNWHEVLQGVHHYALADHGGILVAAKQYEPTNQIVYSTDDGETWHTYNFTTIPIQVHGLLTEPGEKTTIVFLFGAPMDYHSWIVTSINLTSVFKYQCTDQDYKQWSLPDDTPFEGCLLGRKLMIERRVPHTNCYNGKDYVRETIVRNCTCTREDFECDFGYKPTNSFYNSICVEDKDIDVNIHEIPRPCPEGTFYPYTRGYRKISGDTCEGGVEHRYTPLMYACRVQDMEEFMVYVGNDNIIRHVLDNAEQGDTPLVMKENLGNVSAVAYQLGQTGCLYWADNGLHKIQRLCEDGNHTIETLHFMNLVEVTSLVYDWQGSNIYWVDRVRRAIEVSKKNGMYRRELLNGTVLKNPFALAVDPGHGWMYWSDAPKIQRTWMDGTASKLQTVITDSSMGLYTCITIDYVTERIYWHTGSDIKYASLDGSDVQTVASNKIYYGVSALGIYKDQVYWSSRNWNSVFNCDKTNCMSVTEKHATVFVSDFKILNEFSQQSGNTACNQNGGCTQLCLLKPPLDMLRGRNRTCRCGENATLSVILPGSDEDEQCCQSGGLNLTGHCAPVANSSCTEDQFACTNGNCISKLWTCDRDNDCGDRSDEMNCPYETCSQGHFTCDNGRCVPQHWHCDFDDDCLDGSDERGCQYPSCAADHFACASGRCINANWRCDFDEDCPDGSDERNCSTNATVCEENEFVCRTGSPHCIMRQYVCDGSNQCYDGSDEKNCSNTSCPSWKHSCGDGQCVYSSWWCDGDKDCSSGADEANCSITTDATRPPTTSRPVTCSPIWQFECYNGLCISDHLRCDNVDDCGDNSDEMNCGSMPNRTCLADEFRCRNGRCVAGYLKCNSINDCGDYSDERFCSVTTSPVPRCAIDEFLCYNSTNRRCIWLSHRCDSQKDCDNGEDELGCPGETCDPKQFFKCEHSQGCIPRKFVCDDVLHCVDGSDEAGCKNRSSGNLLPSNITCPERSYFPCKYENRCIPYIFVCDGKYQCQHSSDENLPQCFNFRPDVNTVYAKMQSSNATIYWSSFVGPNVTYTVSYLSYINQRFSYHNDSNLTAALSATGYLLKNLHPATTYYITVYANVSGRPVQKYQVITVTTLPDVPDPPEGVTAQASEAAGTIEVSWKDPSVFKGNITGYEVCIGNTESTVLDYCLPTKERRKVFDSIQSGQFEGGKQYFVQVAAFTVVGRGTPSPPFHVAFKDMLSFYVGDLKGVAVESNAINVSWTAPQTDADQITAYRVEFFDQLNTLQNITVDKSSTSVLVKELCAGTQYGFRVTPLTATSQGTPIVMYTTTGGKEFLPSNVSVDLVGPTDVKISWYMPPGADKSEKFTVYYSYKPDVMYSHKVSDGAMSVETTTNVTTISGLRACEVYFFAVQVSGTGTCSLVQGPSIRTSADPVAQPEELMFTTLGKRSGNLTWMSSCIGLEPVGYVVSKKEVATGKVVMTQPYLSTNATHLNLTYKVLYPGATYTFSVMTTNPGARMSESVNVTMEPFAAPLNVHEKDSQNVSNCVLVWTKPNEEIPAENFTGYEVLVCRDKVGSYQSWKCNNDSEYKTYTISKTTMANCTDLEGGYDYSFKVRLNKIFGYYGETSVIFRIFMPEKASASVPATPAGFVSLSQTNIIAIAVSASVVIIVLVGIIAFFVVKHQRLQRSFLAYASSHYDSRSGTTTFSAADELGEDEDSPMIRGFSDDEPLVIA